jgi:hypothetical protein
MLVVPVQRTFDQLLGRGSWVSAENACRSGKLVRGGGGGGGVKEQPASNQLHRLLRVGTCCDNARTR